MGTQRERIIVEGKDDASGAFQQAGGSFQGFGDTLKKVAIAGGIAIAAKKLIELGGAAVTMAIDAGEAASAFNTTFGSAAAEAGQFIEEFANKAGFTVGELQQMAAVTGNVAIGLGATEESAAGMTEEMITLAGDVASFSNASGGAAAVLDALKSATTGETEALKTYGIVISQADVVEQALIETGKTHQSELTKLEKAQATMTLAYERAGKAVGDLERTQDSAANQLRTLQAKFRETATQIGQALLPVVEDVLPLLLGAVEDLGPAFADLAGAAAEVLGPLIQTLLPPFLEIFQQLLPIVSEVAGVIAGLLAQAFEALLPLFQGLVPLIEGVGQLFTNILGPAISTVITIAQPLIGVLGAVASAVGGVIRAIAGAPSGRPAAAEMLSEFEEAARDAGAELDVLVEQAIHDLVVLDKTTELQLDEELDRLKDAAGGVTPKFVELLEAELDWAEQAGLDREVTRELEQALEDARTELAMMESPWLDGALAAAGWYDAATDAEDVGSRLASDVMPDLRIAMGKAEDALYDAEDATDDYEAATDDLVQQLRDAEEAQESLSDVLRAAADPVFDAVDSFGDYMRALDDYDRAAADSETSTEDLARMQLELAEKALEAQGALDRLHLDPYALNQAIASISGALGISEQAARDLLTELGVLDQTGVTTVVDVEVGDIPVIRPTVIQPTIRPRIEVPSVRFTSGGMPYGGGLVILHRGGYVPDLFGGADVLSLLQPGEYVVPKSEAQNPAGIGRRPTQITVALDSRVLARAMLRAQQDEIEMRVGAWR